MPESLITISIVGLVAGFVFSMPVAGPISILIVSNALKGKFLYCIKAAIGAAFADFVYVFIAMIGITRLYPIYSPLIPYILIVGGIFLFYVAYQVSRSQLKSSDIELGPIIKEKYLNRGGFRTGLLINLLNPTLFFGWLSSTFITMSLVTSLGFDMGGLQDSINRTIKIVENNHLNKITIPSERSTPQGPNLLATETLKEKQENTNAHKYSRRYHYLISALYALWLSLGSVLWFYLFTKFIINHRQRINIHLLNYLLKIFGVILGLFSFYLMGRGIDLLI